MNKLIFIAMIAATLAGCSTIAPNEFTAATDLRSMELTAQQLAKPTLSINCSTGCDGLHVEYNDPNRKMPHINTAWDADIARTNATADVINRIVPFAAGVAITHDVMGAISGAGSFLNKGTISGNDSIGGDRVSDSYNPQDNSVNDSGNTQTTNTTTTTTTDSHNQTDSSDNSVTNPAPVTP